MPIAGGDNVRKPAVAGGVFSADAERCRGMAAEFLRAGSGATEAQGKGWIGAIVPHAGWICSGAIAGEAIARVAESTGATVVVIFGAVHTPLPIEMAALDPHARWSLPGA